MERRFLREENNFDETGFCVKVVNPRTNEILGSAFGGFDEDDTTLARIDTIQVNMYIRGQGVGSELLKQFIQYAKERGATCIVGEVKPEYGLNFDKTCAFYRNNGANVNSHGDILINIE